MLQLHPVPDARHPVCKGDSRAAAAAAAAASAAADQCDPRPLPCGSIGAGSPQVLTRHTSHVTHHTSHVTRHTSHVTRHTSHVTRHTSHVTPQPPPTHAPTPTPLQILPLFSDTPFLFQAGFSSSALVSPSRCRRVPQAQPRQPLPTLFFCNIRSRAGACDGPCVMSRDVARQLLGIIAPGNMWLSVAGQKISGLRPQTSNLKPQTSNLKPQTSNLKSELLLQGFVVCYGSGLLALRSVARCAAHDQPNAIECACVCVTARHNSICALCTHRAHRRQHCPPQRYRHVHDFTLQPSPHPPPPPLPLLPPSCHRQHGQL